MSEDSFFESYLEIINDSIKKIRKTGFKKLPALTDFINQLAGFLQKEIYGRIQPSNFLFLYILLLGVHNPKLHPTILQTILKLFSHNFINPFQNLSVSQQFMKNEFKQLVLISGDTKELFKKNFVEIYIQTLINIPLNQRNEQINVIIAKSISLAFRLAQSSIPETMLASISDFLTDSVISNKNEEYDKLFKSIFVEILRHSIESLRESQDRKLLIEKDSDNKQNSISLQTVCERYGNFLFDEVVARTLNPSKNDNPKEFLLVPNLFNEDFQPLKMDEPNEINQKNGKFGWCVVCRKSANFYCRQLRVPVCSFDCKKLNLNQIQEFQKFSAEQQRCRVIFSAHLETFGKIFARYLSHNDIRRRTVFSEIFTHLSSEIRKISLKSLHPQIKAVLREVFRECCANVISESEALIGCISSIKKLIPLKIFNAQVQILLHQIAKKLTHFITPPFIKEQILKFCRDIIKSEVVFEIFMDIDCHPYRRDVVLEVVSAITNVFNGVKPPEGLTNVPGEDPNIKRFCLEILYQLEQSIRSSHRILNSNECKEIRRQKQKKNELKLAIKQFNECEKPTKMVKKLLERGFFNKQTAASEVATFLHQHNRRLNHVNIGILIGDLDPLAVKIRDLFIHQMKFHNNLIDEGLRILLKSFTIPGESQVIERIIDCFSKEYFNQNEETAFKNSDAVYSFSYLLMMLQTNLHSPQVVDKMSLASFSGLSKGMNGKDLEFPEQFLQQIYSSVQKKQLGFHTKHKQLEMINAYQQNQIKKAQEIHNKSLDEYIHQQFNREIIWEPYFKIKGFSFEKVDIVLLCQQLFPQILTALSTKVHESQEKDEISKNIQIMQHIIKFSLENSVEENVAFAVRGLWEEMTKTNTNKKYILMERLLIWVRQYNLYLYEEWNSVIYLFSMFHRNKLIKKDTSGKNNIIVITNQKCYLYDSFINSTISKTSKFNHRNLKCIINAIIETSKQQIQENQHPFCLQKIGEVLQQNTLRLAEILPLCWDPLSQHYALLGRHKNQKISLFGYDFLKQLVTKFLKRKDLQFFQKEYLKPFELIFNDTVTLGVKQYVVGGLSYFASNYHQNINKHGWKIIFNIIFAAFEEEQDPNVKQKALSIVKKIYESKFTIIEIDDNYVDFVQILSRMARQKEQIYPISCIDAIKVIIEYFHMVHEIDLQALDAAENQKLDLAYWQTMWLPLLSTLYGICGDFRQEVQNSAIQLMFHMLMNYGQLFSYQFWKMVMQGILRPAFEQITYTSQSRSIPKKQLQNWLRTSFSLLFVQINKLISIFFKNFELFLPDVLKIYQSCILNNSNRILIQITIQALNDLIINVGTQFNNLHWNDLLDFLENIMMKSIPKELQSEQNWKNSQVDGADHHQSYQNKCQILYLNLETTQNILDKYHEPLNDSMIKNIEKFTKTAYEFCRIMNRNIVLRENLWKSGFFTEMKSLPGLIKQEHEALKGITLAKYYLSRRSDIELDYYTTHILSVFKQYRQTLITDKLDNNSIEKEEQERFNTMLQVIIMETIVPQIKKIGFPKFIQLGYRQRLFEHFLNVCTQKTLCSKCNLCSFCEMSAQRQKKFTTLIKELIVKLFECDPLKQ